MGDVREKLRQWSRGKDVDAKDLQGKLLSLCDSIRDDMLPPLGVRLEDRDGGKLLLDNPWSVCGIPTHVSFIFDTVPVLPSVQDQLWIWEIVLGDLKNI